MKTTSVYVCRCGDKTTSVYVCKYGDKTTSIYYADVIDIIDKTTFV